MIVVVVKPPVDDSLVVTVTVLVAKSGASESLRAWAKCCGKRTYKKTSLVRVIKSSDRDIKGVARNDLRVCGCAYQQ